MTLEDRLAQRVCIHSMRYAIYDGREHDLYLALPDCEKLQKSFKLVFDKEAVDPPLLLVGKKKYSLGGPPLLTMDGGYYCAQGKFKGSKGLHKIKLHRLAYTAFYRLPDPTMHIHHLDHNKLNNRADNLVALTEEEHCQVHSRDVRVPRNLFTAIPPKPSLLAQPTNRAAQPSAMKNDSPALIELLDAKLTTENIGKFLEFMQAAHCPESPTTVLEYLYTLARKSTQPAAR